MPAIGAAASRAVAVRAKKAKQKKQNKVVKKQHVEKPTLRRSMIGGDPKRMAEVRRIMKKKRQLGKEQQAQFKKNGGPKDNEIIVGDDNQGYVQWNTFKEASPEGDNGFESDSESGSDSSSNSEEKPWMLPHQEFVMKSYLANSVQFAVAGLIFANFIVSAAEVQVLPKKGTAQADIFKVFEFFFTIIFTVEVIWNLYGHWFCLFWKSSWNWFDFIIVVVSLMVLVSEDIPGISILRLFRAFRVFRLFKRIKSLKLIIEGVFGALPGVAQAFVVLCVLMGIWSILGVQFFGNDAPEEFKNFTTAMFTMFQIMTMDSWSSGIARKLIFGKPGDPESKSYPYFGPIFFISYIFMAGIVMTNVVVAILLEKYLKVTSGKLEITDNVDTDDEDEESSKTKKKKKKKDKGEGEDSDTFGTKANLLTDARNGSDPLYITAGDEKAYGTRHE